MTQTLLKIAADFETQLAAPVAISDTTGSLVSIADDDGNNLPNGKYGFTIDNGSSSKEYIVADITGTSLANIVSISRQGVSSSGFARTHRRGAKVIITDWAILDRMLDNLDGTTDFDSAVKLGYDADPGLVSGDNERFATVRYVNDSVIAGGVDASSTVKGISKLSLNPVSPTNPIAVGDNDTRVPTQDENDALVGNNGTPATGNTYVTQTGIQRGQEVYAADGGGTDAYAITLSPVPSAYVDGMVLNFKANTANTGAATLNVNSLGAITIKKNHDQDLADNDIESGQIVTVVYDGTNFQMQSQVANVPATGGSTRIFSSTTDATITGTDTSETTMATFTLNGGELGTNNVLHIRLNISDFDSASTSQSINWKLKYGSTTITDFISVTYATTFSNYAGYVDAYLFGAGTTSSQEGSLHFYAAEEGHQTAGRDSFYSYDDGTAAEDSTGNLTVEVTAQIFSATGSRNLVVNHAYAEIIK